MFETTTAANSKFCILLEIPFAHLKIFMIFSTQPDPIALKSHNYLNLFEISQKLPEKISEENRKFKNFRKTFRNFSNRKPELWP